MKRWVAAAVRAAGLGGGEARAEADPAYARLEEALWQDVASCLGASGDFDGDLRCRDRAQARCEAEGPYGGTTYGMAECSRLLFGLWDAELNRVWPDVLERQDAPEAGYLREEQRAWIAYRDALCRLEEARVWGGSMLAYLGGLCRAGVTAERVAELRNYVRNP